MDNKELILIIDDDLSVIKITQKILTLHGYRSEIALGGSAGIQKAFELLPDLILCDIRMEPIDGYMVFNVLKESSLTYSIPFVFITGKSNLKDIRLGMEMGVDDYLIKPFAEKELISSIQIRIEKYKRIREERAKDILNIFRIAPIGVCFLQEDKVCRANFAFFKMLEMDESYGNVASLDMFIDASCQNDLKENLYKCQVGIINDFNQNVDIVTSIGERHNYKIYGVRSIGIFPHNVIICLFLPQTDFASKRAGFSNFRISELVNFLRKEDVALSPTLIERLQIAFSSEKKEQQKSFVNTFSNREMQVLELSCHGLSIKQIADKLNISDRTVEKHRANLMEKTGSKCVVELVIYAIRNNLVTL
ncbi:MAG: response regulator [Bacteroidota bacterium]|nr:response regulator [Bacteroidota bacterium]